MSELKFYKLSLLLPFMVSAAFVPFAIAIARFPEWIGKAILFTAFSGFVVAKPYVGLVVLLLWRARGRTEKQFRHGLILSPVLLLPIFSVFVFIAAWVSDAGFMLSQTINELYFYTPWILGYGYGYVILVLMATCIFRRLGIISSSNAI